MKYETYKAYDPNATSEINPNDRIDAAFADTDRMLEFVNKKKPEIMDEFIQAIEKRLERELDGYRIDEGKFDFEKYKDQNPSIEQYPTLFELTLGFVCKNLGLPSNHSFSDEKITVLSVKNIGSVSIPRYHRIKAMTDVLGRENGIQLYKNFVNYRSQLPVEEKIKGTTKEFREQAITNWSKAKAMDFAVFVFDENKHVVKFTNCISYDALKHLDDPEVGYLTQCYPTTFMVDRLYETLGQRRSVTLFDHPFCDELYWDKTVHKDPEQPSLEFMELIVIE
ncbi:MAG: hypothetical protein ACXAEB_02570 [Candidatus Thorarchaeota archaeon]|jgi:hypothetical protein